MAIFGSKRTHFGSFCVIFGGKWTKMVHFDPWLGLVSGAKFEALVRSRDDHCDNFKGIGRRWSAFPGTPGGGPARAEGLT